MTAYFIYCVYHSRHQDTPKTLLGINGQPVIQIAYNGLCAAVSETICSESVPDVTQAQAYHAVISSFHKNHTVIPVRYGRPVDGKQQVIGFLKSRSHEYEQLLSYLNGYEEMGIRVLLPDDPPADEGCRKRRPVTPLRNQRSESRHREKPDTGRGFLLDRKAVYERADGFIDADQEIIARAKAEFTGLYAECRSEDLNDPAWKSEGRHRLLSLYFLVPHDALQDFRMAFRQLSRIEHAKFLLSGPWPPYNFVAPDPSQRQKTLSGLLTKGDAHGLGL